MARVETEHSGRVGGDRRGGDGFGGEELAGLVDRLLAITGRIDLVHGNDSRDAFDSGADRHANLGKGQVDPEGFLEVVRKAQAPVVLETPGDAATHRAEIQYVQQSIA